MKPRTGSLSRNGSAGHPEDHVDGPAEWLLAWYDRHRRRLPWRESRDPFRIWLSEIMLQQTTVVTVIPYWEAFVARWPTVAALAGADLDEVLHAWQGLGYYARARNLHRCAGVVAETLGGRFPEDPEALARLPGVGVYTANAVAAIAFDRPVVPVDGNVRRVVSRLFALSDAAEVRARAEAMLPPARPGDFAEALMDLGATLCTPRRPRCSDCPWERSCLGLRGGDPQAFPRRAARPPKPTRHGIVFWLVRPDGSVLLRRRPAHGLLGGLMEFPSTPWREGGWEAAEARALAPAADWHPLPGAVRHTFTHFHLVLDVWVGVAGGGTGTEEEVWVPPEGLAAHALPTVMRKVERHVRNHSASVDNKLD